MTLAQSSRFRIEKQHGDAVVRLTSGVSVAGHFFLAETGPTLAGRERIAELLNSESGFFPFEDDRGHTVLYNRDHVVTVAVPDDEARRDPGYTVAAARHVSILLSHGERIRGSIRIYRPEGRDRVSDWARHGPRFRYLETPQATLIVNIDHVVELQEIS
jgi:hypothetical protein